MRQLVWTALMTLAATAGAALGARAANRLWFSLAHEPPPPLPRWARFVVGKPIARRVAERREP